MTTSLKRINRFAFGEARTHKKFFIISNILLGMGGLLYLLMSEISKGENTVYDSVGEAYVTHNYVNFYPSVLGLFLLIAGGAIGMICAIQVFRDMNNVQLGDVQLSLPMTANERYLSKLLALCYLHIFPLILWAGVPSAINALRFAMYGGTPALNDTFDGHFIPLCFLGILAGTLFVEAVAILCTVCCGAFAESIYFTLISITCISVGPALIWYTLTETCAGQFGEPSLLFGVWSLSFVICVESGAEMAEVLGILGVNCLVSVLVMLLVMFIYRRRDARSLGNPIANRVFFECMMFAGLMTVYSMFFFRAEAYIGVIIVGIIYMVIHIITSRGKLGIKPLAAWFGKFLVSTAVFVALSGAAYVTGGFGIVTHLPVSNMEHSDIMISMNNSNENGYTEINYNVVGSNDITDLTDEQVRSAARVFQKYAANHKKSLADFAKMILDGCNSNYSDSNTYSAKLMIDRYKTDKDAYRNGYFYNLLDQNVFLTASETEALEKELQQFDFLERSVETHTYDEGKPVYYEDGSVEY